MLRIAQRAYRLDSEEHYDYPRGGDPLIEDRDMTLVIAVKAIDGIVIVTDTSRTMFRGSPKVEYNIGIKKHVNINNQILIGFSGHGDIAHYILQAAISVISNSRYAADALSKIVEISNSANYAPTISINWIALDCHKETPILYSERIREYPNVWVAPIPIKHNYCCIGIRQYAIPLLAYTISKGISMADAEKWSVEAIKRTADNTMAVHGVSRDSIRYEGVE